MWGKNQDPDEVIAGMSSGAVDEQTAEFSQLSDVIAMRDQFLEDQRLFKLLPEDIHPDPNQPRKHFDPDEVKALASSMDELKQHTPIKIYFSESQQRLQIWFGETRWRAKKDYCEDREILCVLVKEPDEKTKFDNQVDENVQRSSFTIAELLDITSEYFDRYEAEGHSDVTARVAERLKRPASEISRRATVISAMKVADPVIGGAFKQVIYELKLENLSALYFLAGALMASCTDRRKSPARDLVLQAMSEPGSVTKAAAETAYKQAIGKSKLSYSWKPKYLELTEPKQEQKKADDTDAEKGATSKAEPEQAEAEEKKESAPKAPGRVLKRLSVDVLEDSQYLKLTANTGYITKEQALQLADNLKTAAESM